MIELIGAHEHKLVAYSVRFTGDLEASREIVQETFLKLCDRWRKVERKAVPWLYTVCRNASIDYCRRNGRLRPLWKEAELRSEGTEVWQNLSFLQKLLEPLSQNEREVLRLKFQAGLSYKDISDVTHLSVSNVGVILHGAMKKLKAYLLDEYPMACEAKKK